MIWGKFSFYLVNDGSVTVESTESAKVVLIGLITMFMILTLL